MCLSRFYKRTVDQFWETHSTKLSNFSFRRHYTLARTKSQPVRDPGDVWFGSRNSSSWSSWCAVCHGSAASGFQRDVCGKLPNNHKLGETVTRLSLNCFVGYRTTEELYIRELKWMNLVDLPVLRRSSSLELHSHLHFSTLQVLHENAIKTRGNWILQVFLNQLSTFQMLLAGGQRYVTVGLLGTFNGNHLDDLMAPDGHITIVSHPPTEQDNINAYKFGSRCKCSSEEGAFNVCRKA